ncbi:hypothetical protein ATO8_11124 [Roseivivax marinus]|uniref:DNA alkylation repair protein n=1 Tax=Roseivivax marinus TaxID=1379903 RepID=W4HKQ9_9RHOB|nr:hypothetical protein [Roseivivax marinus]ETW12565.1 hypothetical protein ATO8_11124 [Roseivivax marinus]
MARGPDGQGGGAGTSLSAQLFNARTVGDLGAELSVLPGFDAERFVAEAIRNLDGLGVFARLDRIADAAEAQLPRDFPAMADALEAALPPPLDPERTDDDFGRFIHALPGVLAVRHGLAHPDRALDLMHAATQRFSMEYAVRPFLSRWPDLTLARMAVWAEDANYHVRRLVSEGTRPRLPWGANVTIDPLAPLPLLTGLHADPTRYVTRSVANHLNDLTRIAPDAVYRALGTWHAEARQERRELEWMTRHALRTAVKRGEPEALRLLGYDPDAALSVTVYAPEIVRIGATLDLSVMVEADEAARVMVDYRVTFHRPGGRAGEKVFKLGQGHIAHGKPLRLAKSHRLKPDATTFTWHPGPHRLVVQVNGRDRAEMAFEVEG